MPNKQQLLKDFVSQQIQNSKQQTQPIVNSDGFKNGEPPAGSNWRIPGDTLYNPTPYPIQAVSDNGITKTLNPFDESTVEFPGAKYVDEYQMKFGGLPKYQGDIGPSQVIEDTTPRPTLNIEAERPGFWERLKKSNYNPYNWGLPDYSELKSPREALYKAAYYGEPEFMWRGRRQDTENAWESIPEEDRLANVGKEHWTDKPFFIDGDPNLYTEIADNSGNYTKYPKVPIENVKQYQKAYTDALNYTKEWVNSPMYKKMLKESTSGDSPEYLNNIESGRRNNLEQASPLVNITNDTDPIDNTDVKAAGWSSDRGITIVNNLNDVPLSDYERRMQNQDHFLISTDFYNEGTDKFVKKTPETEAAEIFKMNETQKKETSNWLQALFAHEFSHHADRKNNSKERLIPQKDINYILNNQLDYKDSKNFLGNASFFSRGVDDPKQWNSFYKNYVGKPTEVRARLQEIRQYARNNGIYDPFTQEIDDKTLEKLIKNNTNVPGLDDLINIYKPEQIKYMLNHISENKTDNQGVMSNNMQFGKRGGLTKYQGDTGPSEVKEEIKEGDVSPVLEVKGERPGLWTQFKQSYFSPQNWGRDDLSDNYPEGHPMSNYMNVLLDERNKGNTSFMWKNKKHSTEMPWLTRKEQFEQTGITDAQLYARSPFEEMVHENIDPYSYENKGLRAMLGFLGVKEQRREDRDNAPENIQNKPFMGARTDAFNLSMGKPQRRDTFSLSEYRPSKVGEVGWDHNKNDMDYFAINKLKDPKIQKELIDVYFNRLNTIDNLSKKYNLTPELVNKLKENKLESTFKSAPPKEILESYLNDYGVKPSGNFDNDLAAYNELSQLNRYLQEYDPNTKNVIYTDNKAGVMGNFTLGQGVDKDGKKYVSYYDKWDIETPGGAIPFGKPYHIYDRMYYQDAGLVATSPYERIPKSWKEKYDWTPNVEEEYRRFKNDRNAPDNLTFTDDLNDYNVRGMWDSLDRPANWEQALTLYKDLNGEEWVPEEDGYYHAWSQHPGTGEWLKPKHHSTAWMNFAGYPMDPYSRVVVNPEGFFGNETLQTEYKKHGGLAKFVNGGPKEKGWREYKTATGESFYLDPRFKDQRYYVDEKGNTFQPNQNSMIFDVASNTWEGASLEPTLEVRPRYRYEKRPGSLGSMETVRVDLDNNSQQTISPDVMATKREMDNVVNSTINPAGLAVQGISNIAQGNILEGGLQTALSIPIVGQAVGKVIGAPFKFIGNELASTYGPALSEVGRLATTKTPLRNAYKINPWVFKPNPEAYYRGVGKEGIKDALETGVIKSRDTDLFPSPYFARPNEFETALYYNPEALIEAKGIDVSKVKNIEPNQLIFRNKDAGAVPLNSEYVDEIYLGNVSPGFKKSGLENIPISNPNIRLLQKDWLRGYKQINTPKQLPGSGNVSRSIKQSSNKINQSIIDDYTQREIDWLNSEEYIKRNMAATGKSRDTVIKEREKILNQINKTTLNVLDEEADLAAGVYSQDKNNPLINLFNAGNEEQMLNVADHEIKHAVSQQAIRSNDGLIDLVTNPYKNYPTVNTKKWYDYFVPFETTSKWASQAPEQQVVSKRIMDLIEKTQGVKRGTQLTDDNIKGVINLLNTQIKNGNLQNSDMIHMLSAFKSKFGENYYPIVKDMVNKAYALSPVIGAGYVGSQLYNNQQQEIMYKRDGGLHRYQIAGKTFEELMMEGLRPQSAVSDNTYYTNARIEEAKRDAAEGVTPQQKQKAAVAKKKIAAEEKRQQLVNDLTNQGTISPDTQSDFDKTVQQAYYVASNPMSALGHYARYGYVPQGNVGNYGLREDQSGMEMLTNFYNPFSWGNAAYRFTNDLADENTYTTLGGAGNALFDALEAAPMLGVMRSGVPSMLEDVNLAKSLANNKINQGINYLESKEGVFGRSPKLTSIPESKTLGAPEMSRLADIESGMALQSSRLDPYEKLKKKIEFIESKPNLSEDDVVRMFGKSRKDLYDEFDVMEFNGGRPVEMTPPGTGRVSTLNLERSSSRSQASRDAAAVRRANRQQNNQVRELNSMLQEDPETFQQVLNELPAYQRRNIQLDTSTEGLPRIEVPEFINIDMNAIRNLMDVAVQKPTMTRATDAVKGLFNSNPTYKGQVEKFMPSFHASDYATPREMLKDVKYKLDKGLTELKVGDVGTGSTNTSHNSYINQMDFIAQNAGKQGLSKPVFLGYESMNPMGYLSNAAIPDDEIFKYINTKLNQIQQKRGFNLNLGQNAPYVNEAGSIMIPQYGVRKLNDSFTQIKKQEGGSVLKSFVMSQLQTNR